MKASDMNGEMLPSWWTVATQFGYFLGLAAVLGGSLTYQMAVKPGLGALAEALGDEQRDTFNRRSARQLRYGGLFFLFTAYLLLSTTLASAGEGDLTVNAALGAALSPSGVWEFVSTPAGADEWTSHEHLVVVQNLLYGLAVAALLAVGSKRLRGHLDRVTRAVVVLTVLGCVVTSLPTSFAGQTPDTLASQAFDRLHVLAGAIWVGGLICLALLTRRHRLGGAASAFWAGVWQRFSLQALVTVGVVLTSGLWLTWKDVGSWSELLTTGFGRFLIAKLVLVALLMCAGGYNQLVLTPRLIRDSHLNPYVAGTATGRSLLAGFPSAVLIESLLGCCVLIIVPFLTAQSARAQAGSGPADSLNAGLFGLSACLVAALAGSLYATHRLSSHLVSRAEPTSA